MLKSYEQEEDHDRTFGGYGPARLREIEKRFDAVDDRFDRIEKLILPDHKRRIERLEEQVKDLRDLLAIK
jgi:archaellum component FlaC